MAQSLAGWLSGYVAEAGVESEVTRFVERIDAVILAQLPELAADPRLVEALHASTRAHWKVFLGVVERERREVVVPPQAVDLALTIARRGMDIGVLLKVYRAAGRAVWTFLSELVGGIGAGGPAPIDVLMYLWDRASGWIDESTDRLIAIFHDERERVMQGAMARRAQTIQAILDGDLSDVDIAATDLGYPLATHQTAFVLWVAGGDSDATAVEAMHRTVAGLADQLGGTRPLVLSVGSRDLWAWVSTRRAPQLGRLSHLDTAIHVCVGTPGRGLAGFRHGHHDARRAQRLAIAAGFPPGLTKYAEVELVSLISADPDAACELTARELGALTSPAHDVLRETLLLYLESGGSVDRTATALTVHKNTVRYRLHQVESIIGRPLTERRAHLELALRHHRAFGR
ncbi:PucR family transcriptional regulator [Actinokineospora sp. HUAS TT18]|uniref:PucR family transcriptional regulator n=1 Tax=Actinokineospora sp. HUAS TT18 TaxID=3447451 RepID=UPI003F51E64B